MLVDLLLVLAANKRNAPRPPQAIAASCTVVNAWDTGWLAEIQMPPEMATESVVFGFALRGLATATSVYQLESELRDAPEGEKLASAKVTLTSSLDSMFELGDGSVGGKESKEEKKEKKKGKAPVWVRFSVDDPVVKPLVKPSRRVLDFSRAKSARADGAAGASASDSFAAAMAQAAAQQHDAAAAALERLKSPAEDTAVSAQRAQELALQAASEQTVGREAKEGKEGREGKEGKARDAKDAKDAKDAAATVVGSVVDTEAADDEAKEPAAVPMWQQRQAQKQAEAEAAALRSFLKQQPDSGVLVVRIEVMLLTCDSTCQKAAACFLVGPPSPPALPAPPYSAPAPPQSPTPPPPPGCGVPLTYELIKAKPSTLTAQLRMPRTRAIEILGVSGAHVELDYGSHAITRLDSAYFSIKSDGAGSSGGGGTAAATDANGQTITSADASGLAASAEDGEASAWSRAQMFANVSDGATSGGDLLAGFSSYRVVSIDLSALDDQTRVKLAKAAWETGNGEPSREVLITLHMSLAQLLGPKDTPPTPNIRCERRPHLPAPPPAPPPPPLPPPPLPRTSPPPEAALASITTTTATSVRTSVMLQSSSPPPPSPRPSRPPPSPAPDRAAAAEPAGLADADGATPSTALAPPTRLQGSSAPPPEARAHGKAAAPQGRLDSAVGEQLAGAAAGVGARKNPPVLLLGSAGAVGLLLLVTGLCLARGRAPRQARYGRAPRLDEHDLEGADVASSVCGVQPFDPSYDEYPAATAGDDDDDDDDDGGGGMGEPVPSTALAKRNKSSKLSVRLTLASQMRGKSPRTHTFQIKRKRIEKSFDGLCVAVLEALPSGVRLTRSELLRMRIAFEEDGGDKPTELTKQSDMRGAARRASAVVIKPRRHGDDDPAHHTGTDPASDLPHDAKASRTKRKGASGGDKSARKALPPPPMYYD